MAGREHAYSIRLIWEGSGGEGTSSYAGYDRTYRAEIEGKPDLVGSADPAFRGDAAKHNPEDLLVVAISACHMLSYLALCAREGIRVIGYQDDARGKMVLEGGGGRFEEVTLRPRVRLAAGQDARRALELHERAHQICFIANSCRMPIRHEPTVESEDE